MSYILEALKKSQAERELGRVPTLDTSVLFEEDKAEPKRGPWLPLALGLAAAALLLALYAALRGPVVQPPGGAPTPATLPRPEAGSVPIPVPASSARVAGPTDDPGASMAPAPEASPAGSVPGPNDAGATPGTSLPVHLPVSIPPGAEPPAAEPLVEAPPPRSAIRSQVPEPATATPDPTGAGADARHPRTEADLDAELQRELERQLALEPEAEPAPEPEALQEPAPTPVPRELIEEIEAFKDQVRRGPAKAQASPKQAVAAKAQDPTTLRLTPAQEAALPAFMMTVHVYVQDKAQRFVLINGLKYGEGDQTREDLKVEQILPNGAVLSFQGNPFYVRR